MNQKTLHETLEETLGEEIHRGNYSGKWDIEEFDRKPGFKGMTHLVTGDIRVEYNPEYEEKNKGKTEVVVRDIGRHEINHHNYGESCIGCPQTLEKHVELFYEPMEKVLLKKGFSNEDVKYATNALQDTLLHKDLKTNGKFALNGINYFFEEVGNFSSKNDKGKNKFTKFYEAHAKLNMHLWGNKQQKKLMGRFYTHDEKITEVMKAFLEKTKNYDFLNESHWKDISRVYAEEFSKLMEQGYAMPIFNHSGKGTKGREIEIPEDSENSEEEGSVFDRKMKTKDFKKSRIKKAHASDEEAPKWINNFEAMDLLYESLAQKLEIKAKTYTESQEIPVSWYGRREFNPGKDNLKHLGFGFDENGKFGLKKKRFHEDIPINVKTKPESFPRMRFGLLDTSGSMEKDVYGEDNVGSKKIIPWGVKSKYHYALLGWYGFLEYLKQNHLLRQNSVDLGNFSNQTIVGKGLQEAKKIALNPQFGRTSIDTDEISHFFEGRDNLIFTISDGGIGNWGSIKKEFIEKAKKHQYFHLQIGSENSTTMDLRNAGLYVEKVMGDEDLARTTIDLTDKLFRRTN